MLRFNQSIRSKRTALKNLNTSHVKVQSYLNKKKHYRKIDLNTSHVKVQFESCLAAGTLVLDLNTSHVKVQ